MADCSVFMSYSRHDAPLVGPLTQMLRAAGGEVFRDMDSIQPGTKWRVAIASAIDSCQTFLLFWCAHAAASREGAAEYEQAIQLDRLIVPVILDGELLPEQLADYQAIDLSFALGKHVAEVPGIKGRQASAALREPREWELEQGRSQFMKGFAAIQTGA